MMSGNVGFSVISFQIPSTRIPYHTFTCMFSKYPILLISFFVIAVVVVIVADPVFFLLHYFIICTIALSS